MQLEDVQPGMDMKGGSEAYLRNETPPCFAKRGFASDIVFEL